MLTEIRRIVTTNDKAGKSGVMTDGAATNIMTVLTEIWQTEAGPFNHTDGIDHGALSDQLDPPKGGTVFRYFEIGPESDTAHLSDAEKRQANKEWFAAMKGAHLQPDTSIHPAMHQSNSTDYIVLLRGEITLILEREERTLKPFDCVVQRGTNHAWVNRGTEPALLIAVLVHDGSAGH